MTVAEEAISFRSAGDWLYGILHRPLGKPRRGVLILPGGAQYRVGGHRQFVRLARGLAQDGIPAMRFDPRGRGDSDGQPGSWEQLHVDIAAAVGALVSNVSGLEEIVLWGLCDGATAGLLYAPQDPRVAGVVLANPWMPTPGGVTRAYLKRTVSRQVWVKVLRGTFGYARVIRWCFHLAGHALKNRPHGARPGRGGGNGTPPDEISLSGPLSDRVADSLSRYQRGLLLILSGNDWIASSFQAEIAASPPWRERFDSGRIQRHDLPAADHTFTRKEWFDQVVRWTSAWVRNGHQPSLWDSRLRLRTALRSRKRLP